VPNNANLLYILASNGVVCWYKLESSKAKRVLEDELHTFYDTYQWVGNSRGARDDQTEDTIFPSCCRSVITHHISRGTEVAC